MKSNFEERLENLRKESGKDVLPQINPQENAISFINPTEVVDLPSKGKFYGEGHPLKDKNYVEIRQMTAKEEDILTNKSLIRKGIVIDKLIESLLVDKTIPVNTLLVGDKNAIMVAARIAAYGPEYDVYVNCTDCSSQNLLTINLLEITTKTSDEILQNSKDIEVLDYDQLQNGNVILKLPKTNWVVECRLMTGVEERKILGIIEQKKALKESPDVSISEQLKILISSINLVEDQNIIAKAIDNMPAYDAKCLRNTYQKIVPNVFIKKQFVCSSCTQEQDVEVPFTEEFFWPN